MTILYRYPGAGYALLWPFVTFGADYARAAAFAGVGTAAVAKGAMQTWAVRIDASTRVHLPVRTRRDALACVADFAARGATRVELYQGARMRADGRMLWATTDTFSRDPGPEILAPTGLVLKAKLDPLRPGDFRHITSRAAGDLASTDREVGLPAVNRFVDRISNLDPDKGIGAFTDNLKAAAAKLRSDQGKLNQAWVKTADKHFTSVTEDTRRSVKDRFMGGLAVDISQPQVNAVARLVEQQGWFVRGMDGQRNDALTAQARKIVASGLAQGLGRTQIGAEMREKLPTMWQGMGKAYANTVAANGLARARSHAELSSYKEGGIQYAEVVAMLDERTSDICRLMDGQVIPVDGALGLANQASTVSTPEDIGQVSPFLRERRNDQGTLEIRAGSKVLGAFDRTGSGRVDDRGRAQQFTAGSGFIGAKVGAPPYHHNCRTTLVPRMDVAQVPQGYAARAAGPSPAGAGDVLSFGAIEQFKMPTASAPVTTGSMAPVDDFVLPNWKDPTPRIMGQVMGDPMQVAMRVMPADEPGRGFHWTQPWAATNTAALAQPGSALRNVRDAVVHAVYSGDPRTVAGMILANPANVGRDQLLQVRDPKGSATWVRFTGRTTKEVDVAADAVRLATTPVDIAKASEALIKAAVRAGVVVVGKSVDAVAVPATNRVTTGTSGIKAISPIKAVSRVTAEQPQAGAKPGGGPSPMPVAIDPKPVPSPKPKPVPEKPTRAEPRYAGKASDLKVGPQVHSARPDGAAMARAVWKGELGHWSSTSLGANGAPINRKEWAPITPSPGFSSLSGVKPRATDHVVNVQVTKRIDPRSAISRSNLAGTIQSELNSKHNVSRDWIVNDPNGNATFMRIDGGKLAKLGNTTATRLTNEWITSGNPEVLFKLGVQINTDVRKFYPKAEVDWSQRNLIVGVPVAEQVDRRIGAVRSEIQDRMRAAETKKGSALSWTEQGNVIASIVKEGAAKATPSEVLVSRHAGKKKSEIDEMIRQDKLAGRVAGPMSLVTGKLEKDIINFAYGHYSDAMLQSVATMGAPRFYVTSEGKKERSFFNPRGEVHGEKSKGGMIALTGSYQDAIAGAKQGSKARESQESLLHEVAHHAVQAGLTDVAARIARNRMAKDVKKLRDGDISLYKRGGDQTEYRLPGKWLDPYDGKVYGKDADKLRKQVGSPFNAADMQKKDSVDVYDTKQNQEFFSQAVQRLSDPITMGLNWEKAADQVAFMVSAMRGHYVPH